MEKIGYSNLRKFFILYVLYCIGVKRMRLWDYIFPDDTDIIICGAGKNGRYWLSFLESLGKKVQCFFDRNAEEIRNIDGIPVTFYTPLDVVIKRSF